MILFANSGDGIAVADMEVDKVADMEADKKMAVMKLDMVVEMVADKILWLFTKDSVFITHQHG